MAIDSLDDSVTALRKYVFELRESSTGLPDFDQRVQELVSRMASAYPAHVELSIEALADAPWHEELLLWIAEALSNALRHSNSNTISVSVETDGEFIVASVVDTGIGFDPANVTRGMGLANMRERMSVLGGACEIKSQSGSGTVARGTVPLD